MTPFEIEIVSAMPALRRFAIRLMKNVDAAEDLVQSTVCRALPREAQFDPATKMEAWLIVIAKSIRVNEIRTSERRPKTMSDDHGLNMPIGGGQDHALERRDFWRAMHKIPHAQAVVVLRSLQGFSAEEVVSELGIKKGTRCSRASRGIASLKALIAGDVTAISQAGALA